MQASLQSGAYYSPASVALDGLGNLVIPQSGANRIREVIPVPLTVRLSQDRIDFQGAAPFRQSIRVLTNVAEPFPFAVRIQSTGSAAWLSVNRVTGQTGEFLTVSANPAGPAVGVYTAVIRIIVSAGPAAEADLTVTLTAP